MILLGLETATEACSAALSVDGVVRERFEIAPRRHAELILPMVDALLSEAGVSRRALDAIAVGRGPGAFTGVRLAIAVAQGLALALDRPVVPVSTLAALAEDGFASAAATASDAVLALIDARMGEVYAGAYACTEVCPTELMPEALAHPAALVLPERRRWRVVGSGMAAYGDAMRAQLGAALVDADASALPRASSIARLGVLALRAGGGIDPAKVEPVYLRNKIALTLTEQGRA
jgi:tRNA threonylcarbamoyladenosine biosynthesis protein TsaB